MISNVFAGLSRLIELCVSEVKSDVYGNLDKVENVEEEAQEEYKSAASHCEHLNKLTCYAERITYKKEDLEKEALSLCCS